jgi:low temperature requirement protein LtrA
VGGPAFGISYLGVVTVHLAMFAKGTSARTLRAVAGLAPYNLGTALLVLVGGVAGGAAQYVLWALAFVLEWVTPRLIGGAAGFEVAPGHFVERHGLVILIAIGESIVAVGVGASQRPLDLELALVAAVGLALSACLWWAYFGGDDVRAEAALTAAPSAERSRLAIDAFGYWHLVLLLGVIAIAAAEKTVIAHPLHGLAAAPAVALSGGVAVFLLGDVLFRRSLAIGPVAPRAAAAALALVTIPLGLAVAVAQLGALVGVLTGLFAVEAPRRRAVAAR